jgi:hypothetical protein
LSGLSTIKGPGSGERHGPASPASGSTSPHGDAASHLPSILPILLGSALLAGTLGGWLSLSHGEPPIATIEPVATAQFTDAAATLTPDGRQAAEKDERQCHAPIYFITAVTPNNAAGGTVTFHTSSYRSPPFHVGDVPVRIALPNPHPESGGLDPLVVEGDAQGLIVSLFPTATMTPVNGSTSVTVRWPANPPCK